MLYNITTALLVTGVAIATSILIATLVGQSFHRADLRSPYITEEEADYGALGLRGHQIRDVEISTNHYLHLDSTTKTVQRIFNGETFDLAWDSRLDRLNLADVLR